MGQSAYDFGQQHRSCILEERKEFDRLNPGAGQSGFYTACQNGEYLLWQLAQLPNEVLAPYRVQITKIVNKAVKRAGKYAAEAASYAAYTTASVTTVDADAVDATYAAEVSEVSDIVNGAAAAVAAFAAAARNAANVFYAYAYAAAAVRAAAAAATASERQAELQQQADDIHMLIPTWPGE